MFSATLREQHSNSFYAMLSEFLDSYGLTVCAQGDDFWSCLGGCMPCDISQCCLQCNEPEQRAAAGDAAAARQETAGLHRRPDGGAPARAGESFEAIL